MNKVWKMLRIAKKIALREKDIKRRALHGAVAIRYDGVLIGSSNIANTGKCQLAHAESRVLKKAGQNSIIYVVRVTRDRQLRLSRPCSGCLSEMINRKVKKVYYSINNNEYGVINL